MTLSLEQLETIRLAAAASLVSLERLFNRLERESPDWGAFDAPEDEEPTSGDGALLCALGRARRGHRDAMVAAERAIQDHAIAGLLESVECRPPDDSSAEG